MINKKTGETLIEVVVSLTVIMLAGAAAASIVLTALQTTVLSENYLVAQNLAMEAVEIVKNTRDTNYRKEPLKINECWKYYGDCDGGGEFGGVAGSACYNIDLDPGLIMQPTCNYNDRGKFSPYGESNYRLGLYKDPNWEPEDPAIYSHNSGGVETKFYRGIEVTSSGDENLTMNVVVEWKEGAATRRFAAENVTITNFQ